MSLLHVHVVYEPQDEVKAILEKHLEEGVEVRYGGEVPEPPDYEILVAGRPPRPFLERGDRLKTLIIPWAGVPTSTREMLHDFPGLKVHNLHHNAAPTAELALALLFAVAKQIIPLDRELREHDWRPRYAEDHSLLIAGKEALILGYGEIGRRVGEGLRSLGVRVKGIKRNLENSGEEGVMLYPPRALDDLLPETELLFLTLPLTPDTEGIIGEEEIALLPEGAILVNVSRGPIVDQKALYQALVEKKLWGAGLDVWYQYPENEEARKHTPPADYPFQALDNVVLSPHRGGNTRSTGRLRMEHLAKLINAAARGEEMPNRVDLDRGY
ncbi:MAG: hypothetical protein KGY46_09220 [Anaerolineales bacterium]|nr:hypothetical protein [Anaerolineales bacterium]